MKRNIVIATVAAVALIGGGTATALAVTGDDESSAAAKKSSVQLKDDHRDDAKENSAEVKAAKVTAADAIKAALANQSGTAVSAELDDEDNGGLIWDIDILGKGDTWHSVQVDPGTGKVLGSHTEQDEDGDASRVSAALKDASTTAGDAAKAAAAKGTVTSVDLDDDGTAAAWDAETVASGGTESDWHVDLRSAAVSPDRGDSAGHDDSAQDD
ncbi:PepSY domain-containing protein [Streptomyces sp. MZ04]|uniref:PepSY domain-containing protein n=1 Tax=Streptomyces sp. MZ04 TaxID=2559236 RepID=UPI00107E68D2|nr:PepSY domain-containing protein [Streptomyces sp. MZ04]TGB13944.1 peptidase propeptide and YpeB domain protein [Streptomyces sp. MZ04]